MVYLTVYIQFKYNSTNSHNNCFKLLNNFFCIGTSGQSEESSDERKLSIPSKDLVPAQLITKEELGKQAKPKGKDGRRSTLDETDPQVADLNDSSTDQEQTENKNNKK